MSASSINEKYPRTVQKRIMKNPKIREKVKTHAGDDSSSGYIGNSSSS
jgi:hypothetical protein